MTKRRADSIKEWTVMDFVSITRLAVTRIGRKGSVDPQRCCIVTGASGTLSPVHGNHVPRFFQFCLQYFSAGTNMFKNICPRAFGIAADEPTIYDATISFLPKNNKENLDSQYWPLSNVLRLYIHDTKWGNRITRRQTTHRHGSQENSKNKSLTKSLPIIII